MLYKVAGIAKHFFEFCVIFDLFKRGPRGERNKSNAPRVSVNSTAVKALASVRDAP